MCDPTINSWNRAINDTDTQGGNVNVVWHNNLTFNGTPGQRSILQAGSNPSLTANPPYNNIFGVNPLLVNPGAAPTSDSHVQAGAPPVDAGTSVFGLAATDLDGSQRLVSAAVDAGCYERQS